MRRLTVLFSIAAVLVCAAVTVQAQNVQNVVVQLNPVLDEIGDQIEVVQGYYQAGEDPEQKMRISFGIYDTGASVVTLNWVDQYFYGGLGVPIKEPGGAFAEGVGGNVTGDVSEPGIVVSDGMHAFSFDPLTLDFSFNLNYQGTGTGPKAAVVPGVQMFVGTAAGSASLSTISGTPIHRSLNHAGGGAAHIDKQGFAFDLQAMFPDIISEPLLYYVADLKYVDSGRKLDPPTDPNLTIPIRVPLTLIGEDNQSDPGNQITAAPNPFAPNVRLAMGMDEAATSVEGKTFLFDTGAMMSLISTETFQQLGLAPESWEHSMEIAGAAGISMTVRGYDIPLLELPYDNLDGTTGYLQFKDAPMFVLDIAPGIDGILGMNLFNTAKEMLYDQNDPDGASLQLIFDTSERIIEDLPDLTGSENYFLFSSLFMHVPSIPGVTPVPEPATFVLLAAAVTGFLLRRMCFRRHPA